MYIKTHFWWWNIFQIFTLHKEPSTRIVMHYRYLLTCGGAPQRNTQSKRARAHKLLNVAACFWLKTHFLLTVKRTQFTDAEYSHLNFDLLSNGITYCHHTVREEILCAQLVCNFLRTHAAAHKYFHDSILKKLMRVCRQAIQFIQSECIVCGLVFKKIFLCIYPLIRIDAWLGKHFELRRGRTQLRQDWQQ